jgi:signal transduction histidine kinase
MFGSEIANRLRARKLTTQFALTGGLVMVVAMILVGFPVSRLVSRTTIEHTAASTALFMDSFLSPLVQDLAYADALPPDVVASLDRLLGGERFSDRFPHLEIWKDGGLVVYSRSPELIGRKFKPPAGLTAALGGDVASQYADLLAREHTLRSFTTPFLEIYVPIREDLSGRVIAAAEIHEITGPLDSELFEVQLKSWLLVVAVTSLVMLSLFGIVHRGSKLIEGQRENLNRRVAEITELLAQNTTLRERAQRASSRLTEMNQHYLRQVGAELHDGPAQLIGFAALKVGHVRLARSAERREQDLQAIDAALVNALKDIRTISKGLMLPEIEPLPLRAVVDRVVRVHEQRTGTPVAVECGPLDVDVSHAVKICVYRFIQEGLTNAFRHAAGEGQAVACELDGSTMTVTVSDDGMAGDAEREVGLGLTGLRERVESLGGSFRIMAGAERGTRIEMELALHEHAHG